MHYLDNAATTAVLPEVAAAANDVMLHHWGNPSSLYGAGAQAEAMLEDARNTLAQAMGAQSKPTGKTVFFTGGGTAADNIAVLGAARARKGWANHLVCTGYEHPAVRGPLDALVKQDGFTLTEVPPAADGCVDMAALVDAVGPKTALVCAMHVNNETGAVLDVAALAQAVKAKNSRCFVHVDGVQGFCRLPLALGETAIDSYAVSGHKLHAPKWVGALYLAGKSQGNFLPPLVGGGQEQGISPGTQNTAGIAAFAKAVELAAQRRQGSARVVVQLREQLLAGLAQIPDILLHTPPDGYAGIVMLSLPRGLRSQVMLNHLDEKYKVCVSSGSACDAGGLSHTLVAMGLPRWQVEGAIRVSFSGYNTQADVDALLEGLRTGCANLARA